MCKEDPTAVVPIENDATLGKSGAQQAVRVTGASTASPKSELHRRRWFRGGLGLTLASVVAGALWYGWFPNYRPALKSGEVYGVDVSNHQGDIDWRAVARDDIRFAYLKATEGGDFIDKRFEKNWTGAGSADIDRGAYHFFTLCRPGVDQARNFLRAAAVKDAEQPPALDLELGGNCRARPPAQQVNAEIDAFVDLVEAETGRHMVLYVLGNWQELYPVPDDKASRPRWTRRLVLRPTGEWYIWQFTGAAKVAGVRGGVDLNVMRRDRTSS